MLFQHFFHSPLSINSYLIGDKSQKCCAVIDPTRNIGEIAKYIEDAHLTPLYILETHVHADFLSGSRELKEHFKGVPKIFCSALGGSERIPTYCDHKVQEGEEINLGNITLKALHTPGHTPEHVTWLCFDRSRSLDVPWFSFTGDFLFVGSIGRPDLLGEKEFAPLASALYQSIFEKIAKLPDFLEIFPAHSAGSFCGKLMSTRTSSTLGFERKFNPGFRELPLKTWIDSIKEEMPAAPKAYSQIKKINLKGPKLMKELFTMTKSFSQQELTDSYGLNELFIDVRTPEEFAKKHLKNSINIPMKGPFASWAEMILTPEMDFNLILPSLDVLDHLKQELALVGLENLKGYILFQNVEKYAPHCLESFPLYSPEHIHNHLKEFTVIDVRTPAEWNQGHIQEAKHIELTKLENSIDQLPKDVPIATICGSGFRASMAASLLHHLGFQDVGNIQGGMQAWKNANLPVKHS